MVDSDTWYELPNDQAVDQVDQQDSLFRRDETLHHPYTQEYTDSAKDVTKQLQGLYDKGDPEARKAVKDYELNKFGTGFADNEAGRRLKNDLMSREKLTKSSIHDLFFEAFHRNLGTALQEDSDISDEKRNYLENLHGFDMLGRTLFDWSSISKLKLPTPAGKPESKPDASGLDRPLKP